MIMRLTLAALIMTSLVSHAGLTVVLAHEKFKIVGAVVALTKDETAVKAIVGATCDVVPFTPKIETTDCPAVKGRIVVTLAEGF